MAFMGILQRPETLAAKLGSGIGQGFSQAAQLVAQLGLERGKKSQTQELMRELLGHSGPSKVGGGNELVEGLSGKLPEVDLFSGPKAAAVASGDFGALAKVLAEEAKQKSKESFAREKAAEPQLLERGEKLRHLEESGMRFERLNELFSPELEDQFPSSLSVGLFSKNGELRPTAAALLSPDAQEAVKLVSDEISGAKDTFGARVTNFDLQSYMKRLPTLLNTPEGRRRVLRDLRMMNGLNQMYHQGVLDIVERHGGPGKISLSKAESIFKKEFAPKIKEIREEFVNPDKKKFSSMPNASMYSGRSLIDEETGQRFRSDGKEWVPE